MIVNTTHCKRISIFIFSFLILVTCKNNNKTNEKSKNDNGVKLMKYGQKNSTSENLAYITNLYKNKSLNREIITLNEYDGKSSVFVVFENKQTKSEDYHDEYNVNGYLYVFDNSKNYEQIKIDTYYPEGQGAFIEDVFCLNADEDIEKELVIVCSWEQRLKEVAEGKMFQVFVYDNYQKEQNELTSMIDINSHFNMEFEGIQEGEHIKAKYITYKSIKQRLKELIKQK